MATALLPYHVSGSYYEACNCDAICPCRSIGGRPGGSSTHGTCFGTLSWHIENGHAGDIDLTGLSTAMSLRYFDSRQPSTLWEIVLYVDSSGSAQQREALEQIYLGRWGGTVMTNFAAAIGQVLAVRPALIELVHQRNQKRIKIANWVDVVSGPPYRSDETVACGIPGLDRPGQEMTTTTLTSADSPLLWDLEGVCGFATTFDYSSDTPAAA